MADRPRDLSDRTATEGREVSEITSRPFLHMWAQLPQSGQSFLAGCRSASGISWPFEQCQALV